MILITHIIIALSSVISSAVLFFKPAKRNFYITYGLIGATIASGTYLVITTHSSLTHSCITGLIYLGIVLTLVATAQYRLSKD
jgi:hypothetical protein